MAKVKLPRYMRAKRLAKGSTAYFWELPTWARPPAERYGRACPVTSEPLGTDLAAAIGKADRINATFDEWRLGVQNRPAEGSVKALFIWYRTLDRFQTLKHKPRTDYRRFMDIMEGFKLKTSTLGERRVAEIQATHADAIYRALLQTHGKRPAAYCMQVARRVWYEGARHGKAPKVNPFARMNLDMVAERGNRPTGRDEYDLFRAKAREMGFQSMATAAAISFELVRRVSDVFGYVQPGEDPPGIYWEDYAPGEYIALRQNKTGDRQVIPLRGDPDPDSDDPVAREKGALLYPDLEEELARTRRGEPDMEIKGQPFTTIIVRDDNGRRYTERNANEVFRKIRDAAGLPDTMTPTGFRHGGATELGDAGVEDIRPVSGHRTRTSADVYNKITERKARSAGQARRAHVAKRKKKED